MKNIIQIVGGNSDIAFSTSKIFAKNGYDIHLVSKNYPNLETKKKELENNYNTNCKISKLDIENENEVDLFFKNENEKVKIIMMAVGYLEKDEKNFNKIINLNHKSLVSYLNSPSGRNVYSLGFLSL